MDIQKLVELDIIRLMEDNSQDDLGPDLTLYSSAVDCFQNLQTILQSEDVDSNTEIIIEHLHECNNKIDLIVAEESTDISRWGQLCQIKEQMCSLVKFLETTLDNSELHLDDEKISHKDFNKDTILYRKLENERTPQKKIDNEDIQNVVEETIEIPRINGLTKIAGLWEIKKVLKTLIVLRRSQPQLFVNNKACNSLLLFGPPGTGKTLLVHALAFEAKAVLHCVSVSNILSPLVGQSEKNLKYLFQYLRQKEDFSILFIDEIDGLCKKRNDTEQEHSRRIKTELMCQLSKMEENFNMFLICITNCPWDLDTAFLRRFQKRVYIPLPNATERHDLFKLFLKDCELNMNPEIWQHLIDKTEGFSGSDISNLVQHARNIPVLELEDTKIWKTCPDGFYEPVVKAEDFNLQDIRCCELSDLPNYSVRARSVEAVDFLNSLDKSNMTISHSDIRKYEEFIKIKN